MENGKEYKFGLWTVIRKGPKDFECACTCGKKSNRSSISTIKSGASTSCGCYRKKFLSENNPMHDPVVVAKVSKSIKKAQTPEMIQKRVLASKSEETKEKRKKTNQERYGGNSPFCSEEIIAKMKETKFANHGDEKYVNPDKAKITNLEKYGETNPMKHPDIAEKVGASIKKTLLRKGVTKVLPSGITVRELCTEKGREVSHAIKLFNRYGAEHCEDWVNNYDGIASSLERYSLTEFTKANIETITHNKQVKELKDNGFACKPDLIVSHESKTIYVDVDGLYYHSDAKKCNTYHKNKLYKYNKSGLIYLQIREDELVYQMDIVTSLIKAKLGSLTDKYQARNLSVKKVEQVEASAFLVKNHLMGSINSKHLGLYGGDELISIFSYMVKTVDNKKILDIARFATKINTFVIAGFSRLLTNVLRLVDVDKVVSFVDLRYADGNSLTKLGFTKVGVTLGWKWTDKKLTYNRRHCRANMDSRGLSEKQYAEEMKLIKIYDAGQAKFEKSITKE